MYTLLRPRGRHRYWSARITLPGAKPFERTTKCERKSDARRVADRLHAEAATAIAREPLVGALETLIGLRVRQHRAHGTISKLEEKGAQLIAFFGSERDVRQLRLADTTAYVQHRRSGPRKVTDSTIAIELGVLRAALRYLRRLERYDRDPEALWPDELPHGSGVGERFLTWPEYLQVLAAMRPEFRDHLVLYCATGIRFSELYAIQARNLIDTGVGFELRVRGTKTVGADRTVPVSPDALEVLQRRAQAAPEGALFAVPRRDLASQKAAWARALDAACRAAKVPAASTNDLRRTFASWACDRGVPEHIVASWLGHSARSAMLRRVYLRLAQSTHAREGAKLPSRRATAGATDGAKNTARGDT